MLEGMDGSGKTTQAERLCRYWAGQGREVLCLKEPGGTPLGERIRELFLSSDHSLEPLTELLLIEASRHQLVEQVIKPALARGAVVVCQRYTYSSLAYQGHGRGVPLTLIKDLNARATGGLRPDVAFYLRVPVSEVNSRLKNRKQRDRMEQAGLEFLMRVESGYDRLRDDHPEMIAVDGTRNEAQVFEAILQHMREREGG